MPQLERARLIVVCGLPGAGKTTLARTFERTLRAVRLSADDWMEVLGIDLWNEERRARLEQLQWRLAQELLALNQIVVIEWGTSARAERDALRTRARELGAAVELHFVDAPLDRLMERLRKRDRESPPIERQDLMNWAGAFERPTADEFALYDPPSAAGA